MNYLFQLTNGGRGPQMKIHTFIFAGLVKLIAGALFYLEQKNFRNFNINNELQPPFVFA